MHGNLILNYNESNYLDLTTTNGSVINILLRAMFTYRRIQTFGYLLQQTF